MAKHSSDSTDSQDLAEQWRNIPGFEDRYQISDRGRIKIMYAKKKVKPGQIILGYHTNGYHYVFLTKNGEQVRYSMHRLMMTIFRPIDGWEDLDVNHKDGDPGNNVLENLEWCTHSENIRHAIHVLGKMKAKRGESVSTAKLNDDKVRSIRKLHASGLKQMAIARMFGVSQVVISKIINGKTWGHVV